MPTFDRARRSGRPAMAPGRSATWTHQAWPAVIALATVLVLIVFLVQVDLLMAVVMALATAVAATILVTLVTGTQWLSRLRRLTPHLRGHH
ncbi:hypothetical protein ACGFNU_23595 [Spirillospora sp. NPDC048911]|uniref:hypothetical protein n=1 Tax=Spirillospora sp. NPDC048911 TaxID=3364527 RepID=UPI00371E171E